MIYLAGHGEPAEQPADNRVLLWGGHGLSARALAATLDASSCTRPVCLVLTSCFSGGFAELIFKDADAKAGTSEFLRCGLFSTTWDLEASGCDADPDRRNHEGYALHFLHALRGEDRLGQSIDLRQLDLDGDGAVSMLEAHTRARTHSGGLDVPTTSSERWLRHVAPDTGPELDVSLPEEEAVIDVLSARLNLVNDVEGARHMLGGLNSADEHNRIRYETAIVEEDARALDVAGELLARWPVLDDPYHPDFEETLRARSDEVLSWLEQSAGYARFVDAMSEVDAAAAARDLILVRRAPVARLVRALETVAMARRLRASGGVNWGFFQSLRDCERGLIHLR